MTGPRTILAVMLLAFLLGALTSISPPCSFGQSQDATNAEQSWEALGSDKAVEADAAVAKLAETPSATLEMIERHLAPLVENFETRTQDLIKTLDHEQYAQRKSAEEQLITLGKLAEPQLRRALEAGLPLEAKQRVQYLLGSMPGPLAGTPHDRRLVRLARLLKKIDTPKAKAIGRKLAPVADMTPVDSRVPPFYAMLNSPNADDRVEGAMRLARLGDIALPTLPRMIGLLADQTPSQVEGSSIEVRFRMIKILSAMGPLVTDQVIEGLHHKDRLSRMNSAEVLGNLRDARAVPALILALGDKERKVASYASSALVKIGEPSIDPLLAELANKDVLVKSFAVGALHSLRHPRVVQPIARLLYDDDKTVRAFAANSLMELAHGEPYGTIWNPSDEIEDKELATKVRAQNNTQLRKSVIDAVNEALESDNTAARLAATECAYRIAAPDLREGLIKCSQAEDPMLREQAVRSLSVNQHPDVFVPLVACLQDSNANIRAEAANGLRYRVEISHEDEGNLIEPLLIALHDTDRRVRISAAEALGRLDSPRKRSAVPEVIKLLHDTDLEVAGVAIQSLASLGGQEAADAIFAATKNPDLHAKAAAALGSLGDTRALELLRQRLGDKDPQAITALGTLKDRESVPNIIPLLRDNDKQIRGTAVDTLGKIRDRRAVEPLIAVLNGEEEFQQRAAQALGEIGDPRAIDPIIDACRSNSQRIRVNHFPNNPHDAGQNPFAWPLVSFGLPAVEPLGRALKDPSTEVREVAAWALYNLNFRSDLDSEDFRPAVESLLAGFDDSSEAVRNYSAMTLGFLNDRRAVNALLGVVATTKESPHDIYGNAANYLATIRDPKSFEPLVKLMQHDRPSVRGTAARALGWMKDQRAVKPLLVATHDKDPQVRTDAAGCLGNFKDSTAMQPLIALLTTDPVPGVRQAAAKSLGWLGDTRASDSLVKALDDKEFDVKVEAGIALVRLNDQRGVHPLAQCLTDENKKQRDEAATTIGVSYLKNEMLVPPLVTALGDSSSTVRLYTALALGHIGNRPAVDALLNKLTDRENLRSILDGLGETKDDRALAALIEHFDDPDTMIRSVVAYRIANFGEERGADVLIKHLADPSAEVRISIIRVLTKLKSKKAIDPLTKALEDEDPQVRIYVARALERLKR